MTLTEFLIARIAEDEAVAEAAGGSDEPWVSHGKIADDGGMSDETADQITRWSPARTLAESKAKRRIVETARHAEEDGEHALQTEGQWARAQAYEDVLELLALPYAAHPDYDEAWRP